MSWTQPSDVTGSWVGDDAPDDDELVQTWIDRAEREIRARVPDLQARLDDEAETPGSELLEMARDVTVAIVTRIFRNPEGLRQTSHGAGPMNETRMFGGDTPGGLALTREEIAKLSGNSGGAFMIDLMPSSAVQGVDRWLSLNDL